MRKYLTLNNLITYREQVGWFLIWFTLPLSIWYNSIALILGGITFIYSYFKNPTTFHGRRILVYTVPIILFLTTVLGVKGDIFDVRSIKEMEQLLPLLVVPLLFLLSSIDRKSYMQIATSAIVISTTFAGVIMFGESCWEYSQSGKLGVFVYHDLTIPFNLGAVYFSLFLIVALVHIDDLVWLTNRKRAKYTLISFLLFLLFLSATKMLLIGGFIILILKYKQDIGHLFTRRKFLIPIAIILIALLIVPLGSRLLKISNPNIDMVTADSYQYDSPLNGLNLRLIL